MQNEIEQMAKAIYNLDHCEGYKDDRGCMYAPSCSVCKYGRENKAKQISELLAKQGYRKASDTAREIIDEVMRYVDTHEAFLTPIPISELIRFGEFIGELEKKYTEN